MADKEVRTGKAFFQITMRDNLQAGLNRAAARLRAFSAVTSSIGAGLAGASAAILGPLAATVKQFSDAGDAVHKMAARTGLSAEAIWELGHAANWSGTNMQTLETGVRLMQQTIGEAATGLGRPPAGHQCLAAQRLAFDGRDPAFIIGDSVHKNTLLSNCQPDDQRAVNQVLEVDAETPYLPFVHP